MTDEIDSLKVPAFLRKKELQRKAKAKPKSRRAAAPVATYRASKLEVAPRVTSVREKLPVKTAQRTAVSRAPAETPVGIITHYYNQINVGVIKLSAILKEGDLIRVGSGKKAFEQIITSMQYEHQAITKASKGKDIGVKLITEPALGDIVYKLIQ